MVLKNLTSDKIITSNIHIVQNFMDKTFGMILAGNSGGIILKTRFGIHTFLMKDSIDVIILDSKNRVVRICENLLPNRIFLWNPKFDTIIELPSGSIKKYKVKFGDRISFQ